MAVNFASLMYSSAWPQITWKPISAIEKFMRDIVKWVNLGRHEYERTAMNSPDESTILYGQICDTSAAVRFVVYLFNKLKSCVLHTMTCRQISPL